MSGHPSATGGPLAKSSPRCDLSDEALFGSETERSESCNQAIAGRPKSSGSREDSRRKQIQHLMTVDELLRPPIRTPTQGGRPETIVSLDELESRPIYGRSSRSESGENTSQPAQDGGRTKPRFCGPDDRRPESAPDPSWPHEQQSLQTELWNKSKSQSLVWKCEIIHSRTSEGLYLEIHEPQFFVSPEARAGQVENRSLPKRVSSVLQQTFWKFFPFEYSPSTLHIRIEPVDEIPGFKCKRHGPVKQRGDVTVTQYETSGQLQAGPAGIGIGLNPKWDSVKKVPVDEVYATSFKENSRPITGWKWKHTPPRRHESIEPRMVVAIKSLWSIWEIPSEGEPIQNVRFKMTLSSTLKGSGSKLFKPARCRLEGAPQFFDVSFPKLDGPSPKASTTNHRNPSSLHPFPHGESRPRKRNGEAVGAVRSKKTRVHSVYM